jgi:hypothetical protein
MCVEFCSGKTKHYVVFVTMFLRQLTFILNRPLCGKLSLMECKCVCVCDADTFTLNDAQDSAICEIGQKAFLYILNLCSCGAVVECEAGELGDTGSRLACVFKR